jgi:hypothetical protein
LMADIDQIIAGGQGATSRADFSGLADIPEAYWKGRDRAYTQEGRDLFKGGIPTIQNPDGTTSVDWGQISKALLGHGDVPTAVSTENVDIARQKMRFGNVQSGDMRRVMEGGDPTQTPPTLPSAPQPSLPPSVNRQAPATTPPPQFRGGAQQPQAAAGSQGGSTVMQIVAATGIPNTDLENASASVARQLGVAPGDQIDVNDPQVRNVLVPALQQLKRASLGNVIPDGQSAPPPQPLLQPGGAPMPQPRPPGAPGPQFAQAVPPMAGQPVPGSSAPIVPTPVPTQAITQSQPSPVTSELTTTQAPPTPSRAERLISYFGGVMSDPRSPPENIALAKIQLERLSKNSELTPEQKNYAQKKLEGFPGTMQELAVKEEEDKTYAAENTKSYIKKYDAITKAGGESAIELPKLALAKQIMASPDFYTGPVEGLNLAYKRILATIDPSQANAAQPQEAFRKIISDSVRSQIRSLAESGVGRISIPEVRIIEKAAANQENTPAANRLLVELSTRMHQQTLGLDELARNYNGGRLNPGFDTAARAWVQQHPVVSSAELKDPRIIAPPVFATPDAVRNAGLPRGSPFQTPDGRLKYVP